MTKLAVSQEYTFQRCWNNVAKDVFESSRLPIDVVLQYISLFLRSDIRRMNQYHSTSLCLHDHFMKTVSAVTSTK